jgi:8-amino-7-oxononanoate synthase
MPGSDLEGHLRSAIEARRAANSLRSLSLPASLIDFCSNDYLGFARSPRLRDLVRERSAGRGDDLLGSTGSRLISGNSELCESLEREIADFHRAQAGLIFNSGYDANLGVFSSIPGRSDTVLYDELAHASIRDGIRLTFARSHSFRHNDLDDFRHKIGLARGHVFVAVESVYSMDGDTAPLSELVGLCRERECDLVVDEAHATGVFGPGGRGLVVELGLQDDVFARVHTFGKALGSHGAIVLGSQMLRTFLINFARSFIYTTFLPPHSLLSVACAYEMLPDAAPLVEALRRNIALFRSELPSQRYPSLLPSDSAIQSLLFPGNDPARQAARYLQDHGFDVRAILSPSVPPGKERLRICLHAFNETDDVQRLAQLLAARVHDAERTTAYQP